MSTLLLLGLILLGSLLLSSLLLWLVGRLVKAERATYPRALLLAITLCIVNLLIALLTLLLAGQFPRENAAVPSLVHLVGLLIQVVASWILIRVLLRTSRLRGLLVWLAIPAGAGLSITIVYLLIVPHYLAAYVSPTNAMAPTLVGWHRTSMCPHCGQALIVPALPPAGALFAPEAERIPPGICTDCYKVSLVTEMSPEILAPDRFLVNKKLTPQRWDLVVFLYPEDPTKKYTMRLVGLPGEEVYVKDGDLWIDGAKAVLPESLVGLRYAATDDFLDLRGTPELPLKLSADEYCVLGDFSMRSSDSRFWGPVPAANMEGVVTLRYWPMSRWKIWR